MRSGPFATVSDLHAAMMGAVRAAPREQQLAFVRNHPDLAGKAARAGDVTDDSRREQASAGLDTLSRRGVRALPSPERCLQGEVRLSRS